MSTPSNTGPGGTSRRRSQRVLIQVSVEIRGHDTLNKQFEELTETLAINAHGALVLLAANVAAGEKVTMKHVRTNDEQKCNVVFLGPARGRKIEVGLEFCTPQPMFWRVAFPPEDWTLKHPDARGRKFE
jgi:hypothetical protein